MSLTHPHAHPPPAYPHTNPLCSHIHTSLRNVMLDVRKVNVISLYQLQLDVSRLIEFAQECAVPQLPLCFGPCLRVFWEDGG